MGGGAYCTLTCSEDFAEALAGLFLNPRAMDEDFHMTSGWRYRWEDVLSAIYDELSITPDIRDFPTSSIIKHLPEYREELITDRSLDAIFDNRKIKEAVPEAVFRTSLKEGIRRVISYYASSPVFDYDFRYDARMDRMLPKLGEKGLRFIPYRNCGKNARETYLVFRYLPPRIANKLNDILIRWQ